MRQWKLLSYASNNINFFSTGRSTIIMPTLMVLIGICANCHRWKIFTIILTHLQQPRQSISHHIWIRYTFAKKRPTKIIWRWTPPFGFSQVRVCHTLRSTLTASIPFSTFLLCVSDFNYKYKLATGNDEVESCQPNPCQNDGKCISNGDLNRCQCVGHFTGRSVNVYLLLLCHSKFQNDHAIVFAPNKICMHNVLRFMFPDFVR